MRAYKIRARRTGVNFGWVGEVVARNGRVVAVTGNVYPFEEAAERAAEELARKREDERARERN